jgi:MATE family multidrug resistance protein
MAKDESVQEPLLLASHIPDDHGGSDGSGGGLSVREEVKKQLWLAGPLIAGALLQNLIQMISIMYVGHLGELALAGASMASSFASVTGFSLLVRSTHAYTVLDTCSTLRSSSLKAAAAWKMNSILLPVKPMLIFCSKRYPDHWPIRYANARSFVRSGDTVAVWLSTCRRHYFSTQNVSV